MTACDLQFILMLTLQSFQDLGTLVEHVCDLLWALNSQWEFPSMFFFFSLRSTE